MENPNNSCTNWPELYTYLNLQPNRDALFVLDYATQFDQDTVNNYKNLFLISGEGNTVKFQHLARPGVWFFDSIVSDQYPEIKPWLFHFYKTVYVNTELNLLEQLATTPVLAFDALLGLKKPHRDCAYDFITADSVLNQRTFLTYYGIGNKFVPGYHNTDPLFIKWSSENIMVNNVSAWRSQILPVDIYNQTSYTLICETDAESNTHSFFTEKIAKPMLAGRLFVVLANQYYLKRLKQLGFKTFDSIIDESYDAIADHTTRWQQALIQMRWLAQQPSAEIYAQAENILKHNQLIMQTDWQQKLADQISQLI